MKKDVQLQVATCPPCDKFHTHSKRQRGKQNSIPTHDRGDILAIDVFGVKVSLPETHRANRYIVTMINHFTNFGVASTMPEQSAETVTDALLSQLVLLFGAP